MPRSTPSDPGDADQATPRKPEKPSADPYVPDSASLPEMRAAVQECRGCDLYKNATQAVFGEGPERARIMLIGEQPGDQEDRKGEPFVGPAGAILDKALSEAGISRSDVYLTNAVKHFKFEPRGKRRIHKKPGATEIRACRPWLDAELRAVDPEIVVCLGAVAAQAIMSSAFRLMQQRGKLLETTYGFKVLATIHPSAVLRAPESEGREQAAYDMLVSDLKVAARAIQ